MSKFIIANFKMKQSLADVNLWIQDFKELFFLSGLSKEVRAAGLNVVLAPSHVHMPVFMYGLDSGAVQFSSQDVSDKEKGSYTGEVGAFQIRDMCKYSIVGHSERNESVDIIVKKRDICLQNEITPIVCFKTKEEAVAFEHEDAILAWEDPDSISVDGVFRPKDVGEVVSEVELLKKTLDKKTLLLYGGSVNTKNMFELKCVDGLSGFLVGQSSLNTQDFIKLVKEILV